MLDKHQCEAKCRGVRCAQSGDYEVVASPQSHDVFGQQKEEAMYLCYYHRGIVLDGMQPILSTTIGDSYFSGSDTHSLRGALSEP